MFYNNDMANIFTKNEYNFEQERLKLINTIEDTDLKFFLEHHYLRIENLYDFLYSNKKIFVLSGFQASGKDKVIKTGLKFLPENVCQIIFDCPESICLDDLMLFIYNRIRTYCDIHKILLKKPNSQDFMQMLNECLGQINFPLVLVLNSFEYCINNEQKTLIIDFLYFLNKFSNIKIIISARQFSETESEYTSLNIVKYISKAFEKETVNIFFQKNNINLTEEELDKFYNYSRGYYGYCVISINILKAFSFSMSDFLDEYEIKSKSFDDFLIDKMLSLVSDNARNILEFLAILRINFPISAMLSLNFASQEEIDYLVKKNLVCRFENSIYIKDFIKTAILKDTKIYTQYKIHKFMIDLFESQLPLKPKERIFELSRHTMREEIMYHTQIVKSNTQTEKPSASRLPQTVVNMSYISYSRGLKNKMQPDLVDTMEQVSFDKSKTVETSEGTIFAFDSNESANVFNRIDMSLIKAKNSTNKHIENKEVVEHQTSQIDIGKLLESASELEKNAEYLIANDIYFNLCEFISEENQLIDIYKKLGANFKKLNDYTNSIDYLERVYSLLPKEYPEKDILNLEIADLYKDSYKNLKAKNIYFQILSEGQLTPYLEVKCNLGLAEIENKDFKFIYNCFQKVFDNIDKIDNPQLKSEVYFKFALLKDDENKLDEAIKYYNLSIQTCHDSKQNLFLSSCYSNIASIHIENNEKDLALKNFQKALLIDKENGNYEGIYYCNSQMAELLENKDKILAKNHYILAIKAAKSVNDKFYIVSAYLKYGDFCAKYNDSKSAIKQYLRAKTFFDLNSNDENLQKISVRLNDLKIKLGKDKYMNIIREIKNNE